MSSNIKDNGTVISEKQKSKSFLSHSPFFNNDQCQLVSNHNDKHNGVKGDISMKAKAVEVQWGPLV